MEEKLINSALLRKLEGLKLNSGIVLNKGYSGGRKSKAKGSSLEFSDFREYVPGDDFKKIDWNAVGRFEKVFVKLFMEERETLVHVFLDTSKSMDFGQPKKSYVAKVISLALGYISFSNLDRVNIFTGSGGVIKDTGYMNGKNSLTRLASNLDSLSFDGRDDLFSMIKSRPYKKGISIIISDFFTDNLEDSVRYLSYMNQSVVILHLLSKEEVSPDIMGDLRLIDSESEAAKDISITSTLLDSYEKTLKEFLGKTKEISKKYGCSYSLITNDIPIEGIIFENLRRTGILR